MALIVACFALRKEKQQAIMAKFEKLMPVSLMVKAFCKAMKSLIEDDVVVNDMERQLKAELVRVNGEIPRIICTLPHG